MDPLEIDISFGNGPVLRDTDATMDRTDMLLSALNEQSCSSNGPPRQSSVTGSNGAIARQSFITGSNNGTVRQSSASGSNNGLVRQNSVNDSSNGLVRQSSQSGAGDGFGRQSSHNGSNNGCLRQNSVNHPVDGLSRQNSINDSNSGLVRQNSVNGSNNGLLRQNSVNGSSNGLVRQNSVNGSVRKNSVSGSDSGSVKQGLVRQSSVNVSDNVLVQQVSVNGLVRQNSVSGSDSGSVKQGSVKDLDNGLVRQGLVNGSDNGQMRQAFVNDSIKGLVRQNFINGSDNSLIRQNSINGSNNGLMSQKSGSSNGLLRQSSVNGSKNGMLRQSSVVSSDMAFQGQSLYNGDSNGIMEQSSVSGQNSNSTRQNSFHGADDKASEHTVGNVFTEDSMIPAPFHEQYSGQQKEVQFRNNTFDKLSVIALADEEFVYRNYIAGDNRDALMDYGNLQADLNEEITRGDGYFSAWNPVNSQYGNNGNGKVDRVEKRIKEQANAALHPNRTQAQNHIETNLSMANLKSSIIDSNSSIVRPVKSDDVYELLKPHQTGSQPDINYSQSDLNYSSSKNGKKKDSGIKRQHSLNGRRSNTASNYESLQIRRSSVNGSTQRNKDDGKESQSDTHKSRKAEFEQIMLARENSFKVYSKKDDRKKLVKQSSKSDTYEVVEKDRHHNVGKTQDDHSEKDVEQFYNDSGLLEYQQLKDFHESSKAILQANGSNSRSAKPGIINGKSKNSKNSILKNSERQSEIQIDRNVVRHLVNREKISKRENDIETLSVSESERFEPYVRLHGNIDVELDSQHSGTFKGNLRPDYVNKDLQRKNAYKYTSEYATFGHKEMLDKNESEASQQKPGMEYWVYPTGGQKSRSSENQERFWEVSSTNFYNEGYYGREKLKKSEFKQELNRNENNNINYGQLDIMFKHVQNDQFKMVMVSDVLNNERQITEWEKEKHIDNVRYSRTKLSVGDTEARIYFLENKEQASVYV